MQILGFKSHELKNVWRKEFSSKCWKKSAISVDFSKTVKMFLTLIDEQKTKQKKWNRTGTRSNDK